MTALSFLAHVDNLGPFPAKLEVTQETVDVSTLGGARVPDLAWETRDESGHYHAWTKDGDLPTLGRTVTSAPCRTQDCIDGEDEPCYGMEAIAYSCLICHAEIEPAYKLAPPSPEFIPGRQYWEASVLDLYLDPPQLVSVMFTHEPVGKQRTIVLFGVGTVTESAAKDRTDRVEYVTKIYGNGALGRR